MKEIKKPPYTPEELNSNIVYGMTGVNNINEDELKSVQWLCEKSINDDVRIKELEEKLAKFEKFGNHSNITVEMFIKAVTDNFYYIDEDWLDIFWSGNRWIYIGNGWSDHFIQTRPHHCEDCEDAHIFDWGKDKSVSFKDYGKTWALTREELEEELKIIKLDIINKGQIKYTIKNINICVMKKSEDKYIVFKHYVLDEKLIVKTLNVCKTEKECEHWIEEHLNWYK